MTVSGGQPLICVQLGDRTVEAEVRRSELGRTTRIQVGRDVPLRVIVPAGASDEYAAQSLRNKASWVLEKLQAVEEARRRPAELGLERPGVVWLHAEAVPVVKARVRYSRLSNGSLLVPEDGADASVKLWYHRTARAWLRLAVAEESSRLGVDVAGVGVRDQRTRWGSCSRSGHISLNWRLLLVPEHVARYVIVHELVHLRVPNHSKAFWRQLGGACPEWRTTARWLERHGDELRAYRYGTGSPRP